MAATMTMRDTTTVQRDLERALRTLPEEVHRLMRDISGLSGDTFRSPMGRRDLSNATTGAIPSLHTAATWQEARTAAYHVAKICARSSDERSRRRITELRMNIEFRSWRTSREIEEDEKTILSILKRLPSWNLGLRTAMRDIEVQNDLHPHLWKWQRTSIRAGMEMAAMELAVATGMPQPEYMASRFAVDVILMVESILHGEVLVETKARMAAWLCGYQVLCDVSGGVIAFGIKPQQSELPKKRIWPLVEMRS